MTRADLLIEIHTGELPPKSLLVLANTFLLTITDSLSRLQFQFDSANHFVTPRRLAVLVKALSSHQPTQLVTKRGPAKQVAFDANGEPTQATLGFLRSLTITLDDVITIKTEQGEWIGYQEEAPGKPLAECLPGVIEEALTNLPTDKRMQIPPSNALFIRPIHSICLLYGDAVIPATILGIKTDRKTRGHRFHAPNWYPIKNASTYEAELQKAYVVTDFTKRRSLIIEQAETLLGQLSKKKAALLPVSDDFLNEVTGLVEWPESLLGSFDETFLTVPKEVLVSSMQDHQRYFAIIDQQGQLLPYFILVSNIKSRDPKAVLTGNERVLTARLNDAAFFYHTDQKETLQSRLPRLKDILFKEGLGSLYEKASRLGHLINGLKQTISLPFSEEEGTRAGELAKTDLVTLMVGEFPELQGIMGGYYARHDQESHQVAAAISEHYLPRFSGDDLPETPLGTALALADRLDNLVGTFGLSQLPTGDKDPYGLRRAAIGVIRLVVEKKWHINLSALIDLAVTLYDNKLKNNETKQQLLTFFEERMRVWLQEKEYPVDVIAAVNAIHPVDPYDFYLRVTAVHAFKNTALSKTLQLSFKRVSNILTKNSETVRRKAIDMTLLKEPAEEALVMQLQIKEHSLNALLETRQYEAALTLLSELNSVINNFFDNIMIMVDDIALRENRILILSVLRSLFIKVADIALLQ